MWTNWKISKDGITDIYRREMGLFRPRNVARRFSASEVIMKQINLCGRLHGHEGCVNAVEFNSTGEFLVSGSDDKLVIFWDWKDRSENFAYLSGHLDNIFQTRIMPFTDDRKIVTSSADGQVRLGQIFEDGRIDTKRLGKHRGRVYRLAVEPGSPYIIYSCGEDGFVQHFDLRSDSATRLFYCSSFTENSKQPIDSIRLNSIVIDPRNPNFFAVGGSDEFARVYDIRKCHWYSPISSAMPVDTFCPYHLIGKNNVHITGLAYSNKSELLISYNDELIYLFEKNMGMGLGPSPLSIPLEDLQKREEPQVYSGHRNSQTVKGVNFFGPNDEYVMSGSDCGHIFIWTKKGGKLVRLMIGDRHIVNQLEPHPHIPMFATCGIEKSVKLWAPMPNDFPPLPDNAEKIMEANKQGREDRSQITLTPDIIMHVLRLQRRQTLAYRERRYNAADAESYEEEGETYVLGFSDSDASSEGGNQRVQH